MPIDVIYAEKLNMAVKITAALNGIQLSSGRTVSFDDIEKYDKQINEQAHRDRCFAFSKNGNDVYVTWGMGHLCELKQAADYDPAYARWRNLPLPYIPDRYELKLRPSAPVQKQYAKVKELFSIADRIIMATDNDREGDLIGDYVMTYMRCRKPFMRAVYNKQSAEEFQKSFAESSLIPGPQRRNIIMAGRARSAGDFLVGAGPTVAMTLYHPYYDESHGKNAILSVGRVQTATLAMVVTRENDIKTFKPEPYYTIGGKFSASSGQYSGTYETKRFDKKKDASDELRYLREHTGEAFVLDIKKSVSQKEKPHLYSLQTLEMDANRKLGMSLKDTDAIAQSLYDKGFTTYPRTDSVHLPEDMAPAVEKALESLFSEGGYGKYKVDIDISSGNRFYFDNTKVESHYAIVPTGKIPQGLNEKEKKVYDMIARAFICMAYPKASIAKTVLTTDIGGKKFTTTGSTITSPGFYTVVGMPKEVFLPDVKKGEKVKASVFLEEKKTEPPKRYTDGTLLNAMITCGKTIKDEELKAIMAKGTDDKPRGLGRPSTQARIVSHLEERGYIRYEKKTIFPTDKGIYLIRDLPVEDLKSPVMTAYWEKRLDDIEAGKDTYESFMRDLENKVRVWTNQIKDTGGKKTMPYNNTGYKCPICGRAMQKQKWGYGCSGYFDNQACTFSIFNEISGVKITNTIAKELCENKRTHLIKGFKWKGSENANGEAYLVVTDEGKIGYEFPQRKTLSVSCPWCQKALREKSTFYGCTGFPDCKFTVPKEWSKHVFTEEEIGQLTNGETIQIKNKEGYFSDIRLNMDGERTRIEYV